MRNMELKELHNKVTTTFLISNISDTIDDNDPILIKSLENKFEKLFSEFITSYAFKVAKRTKEIQNISEDKSTRNELNDEAIEKTREEVKKYTFTDSEINSLKPSFLKNTIEKLTAVPLSEFNILDQKRIERFIAFLENKKKNKSGKLIDGVTELQLRNIFNKYKEHFLKEKEEIWLKRFIYPNNTKIESIEVTKEAREGTNKLILLAILSSIQKTTGNAFNFEKFTSERFGLLNFQKTKTKHCKKLTFKSEEKICDKILTI